MAGHDTDICVFFITGGLATAERRFWMFVHLPRRFEGPHSVQSLAHSLPCRVTHVESPMSSTGSELSGE
jgi:hypothetical protein